MSEPIPALDVRGLQRRFGAVVAVDDVDLAVAPGEILALLGPSGCGKTTALRMIAGFEEPDAGTIDVAGVRIADPQRSLPPERRSIGMVFQDGALFPHLSVAKNVAFGLHGANRSERVDASLSLVGLSGHRDRMPHELSGGQQQRVALARALAPHPRLILLDEPFSSLDAALRTRLRTEVRAILKNTGVTTLLVTHDQEEALSMADRVAVMWTGRLLQVAPPDELYLRPVSREVAAFVGDAQFLQGERTGAVVRCALGSVPAHGAGSGLVDIMVRPEILRLHPATASVGAPATIRNREFFGHDQLLECQLADGTLVRARAMAYSGFHPGDDVKVEICGPLLTFSREARE